MAITSSDPPPGSDTPRAMSRRSTAMTRSSDRSILGGRSNSACGFTGLPRWRTREAIVERISYGDAQVRQAPLHLGGHVAGAAAHLQEADSGREVRLQRPRDERVARAKPEAPVLDVLQMVEGFLEEALLAREVGREPQVAVVLGREAA
jgi:hypothetical protein